MNTPISNKLKKQELEDLKKTSSFIDAIEEYSTNFNFNSEELSSKIYALTLDTENLSYLLDKKDLECLIEEVFANTETQMLFDIIELDQSGESISEKKWFTVMIENNEYEVVEEWLENEDLNSFSTSYTARPSEKFEFCFLKTNTNELIGLVEGYEASEEYKNLGIDSIPFKHIKVYTRLVE